MDGSSTHPDLPAPQVPPTALLPIRDEGLPIFDAVKVEIAFGVTADFAAAQVANNVLILGLHSGRIMRIDLDVANEVDDIDLPKTPAEVGVIKRLFLDPTASHLLICTTLGENFYLHTQSKQPKQLSRLRGVAIESVSWNPSQPTASTREILIGAADGTIYETYIDPTADFLRREEKYSKVVYRVEGPASGIWTDTIPGKPDLRRVMIATPKRLLHFFGKLGRHGHEGSGSIFHKLFESESPEVREINTRPTISLLTTTPEPPDVAVTDTSKPDRIFAWLSAEGTLHGELLTRPTTSELGKRVFSEAKLLEASRPRSSAKFASQNAGPSLVALTQWHILQIIGNRIVAVNRLDDSVVYDQVVLDAGQRPLALAADTKNNTYWLFTSRDIFEIVVRDEDRDIWKIMLKLQKFEDALQYANNSAQKDAVATASGDFLLGKGQFMEAASVYGKSSKPFEQVALEFLDRGEKDALRKYLTTKLSVMKKSAIMQRIMLTSWLTEVYMAKLNSLDDMVNTKAELAEDSTTTEDVKRQRMAVKREFEEFIRKYKADLDSKTVYDIISSHGREDELLYFSSTIGDMNFVLQYWTQRENWPEALKALNRQSNPDIAYKYSSVLMANAAPQFIDIITRQPDIEPRKLIPAFLNYNQVTDVPVGQNQAIRYLRYEVEFKESRDAAVHNTLISMYAAHLSKDETPLLAYLQSQTPTTVTLSASSKPGSASTLDQLPYDADFALRLCTQHSRIRSSCLIYTAMGQHTAAVALALSHGQPDLAISIAERPENDAALSKRLWLAIARAVIQDPSATSLEAIGAPPIKATEQQKARGLAHKSTASQNERQSSTLTTALSLLRRAPAGVLRIEDLLPLLPDFILIDSLKEEICTALARYSSSIESLKKDMDASAAAASRIRSEISSTKNNRWVLIQPGERCSICKETLLDRRFWAWACGHTCHGDCTLKDVERKGTRAVKVRVRELRTQLGTSDRAKKTLVLKELDELVGKECPFCGARAVSGVDEPFVSARGADDDGGDWSL